MAGSTVSSEALGTEHGAGPRQFDLDRCVHCGLCLNACPTYRVLGLEMDSPRGRIYQMVQVAEGAPLTPSYLEHIGLCLGCRGCETACPSGVPYGRMLEDAREEIEVKSARGRVVGWVRKLFFHHVLRSRAYMTMAGALLYLLEASGMKRVARSIASLKLLGPLGDLMMVAPSIDPPFFFSQIGKTFPAEGEKKHRVAFLAGCLANVAFARLNEATVRVLQKNGCEVVLPSGQGCCGALHLHAGLRQEAQELARRNIDALLGGGYEAIISNAGGCGATLKEYGELLADDPAYAQKAREFAGLMRDVTEFLVSIELNGAMKPVDAVVTYQDSCHLAHGQKVRSAPRKLLSMIPGVKLKEMRNPDLCCGSAGIYNVIHPSMAVKILASKMESVNASGATVVASSNPGCMLQLQSGVRLYGDGQKVMHVVELLDQAYRNQPGKKESAGKAPKAEGTRAGKVTGAGKAAPAAKPSATVDPVPADKPAPLPVPGAGAVATAVAPTRVDKPAAAAESTTAPLPVPAAGAVAPTRVDKPAAAVESTTAPLPVPAAVAVPAVAPGPEDRPAAPVKSGTAGKAARGRKRSKKPSKL